MEPDDQQRVTLELEPRSEPIAGSLTDERGRRTTFSGWLALARLLERARNDTRIQPHAQPAEPTKRDQG